MTVSREQSVDHKLTDTLVLLLCSLGSRLESVIADDVFLILHAYIITPFDPPVNAFRVFISSRMSHFGQPRPPKWVFLGVATLALYGPLS